MFSCLPGRCVSRMISRRAPPERAHGRRRGCSPAAFRRTIPAMKNLAVMFACASVLATAVPAFAHHSAAAFDGQKKISVTGKVVEYRYMNPHIYLTLEVTKADGTRQRMDVEAGAASVLNALGFTRDKLKVGDIVTIAGSPSRREPDKLILGRDLTKQKDNAYVPLNIASRSVYEVKTDAVATSIAGTWFSTSFGAYMG